MLEEQIGKLKAEKKREFELWEMKEQKEADEENALAKRMLRANSSEYYEY